MPLAFVIALAASLGIHAAALFGTDVEIFGGADEPAPLLVDLQPPPAPPPAAEPKPALKPRPKPARQAPLSTAKPSPKAESVAPVAAPESPPAEIAPNLPSTVANKAPAPAKPLLPAKGRMRFVIYYGTQGFEIGRAEHRWEFTEDGRYRLAGMTETTGLVALFKPLVFENESSGRLVAGGLQPETYRTRKNGKDANENADFDWSTVAVRLSRSGASQPVSRGAQDILSLNYQLAYLRNPEGGTTVGVVTGKKYDRFALDSLGEEEIDLPAGHFRTLHLRAMGDTVTEIWIALDRHRLPVKIRYTDKKGDIFEQVATEIGSP
ncbi:MAG: DUF3108 domain-containing protein [Gammaproteobacteria bacterium]|nr:DUF3108 domain-containing protein [Gammaproteobacteria bacterium]MBU1601406.1 DUF3108 domain-containing protein [Gammaproteobacteria bacterium]MBU2433601.1 DUF3108 domain-containing protein [Gammaproteobacteria bacterium]MBU2449862.1 DUF3108 domain-containing protein [Gammaproteobacteria bacterium]